MGRTGHGLTNRYAKFRSPPFAWTTTEVTVAAYRACVKTGKCATIEEDACTYRNPKLDDYPIDCATWAQADQFCRAMGKRLPTEEEWEYGARGMDRRRYPWGNSDPHYDPSTYGYKEFCQITPGKTPCPVDQFKKFASPFGLLNMTGNLSEWTSSEDCEPKGPCRRIVRGSGSPSLASYEARIVTAKRLVSDHPQSDFGVLFLSAHHSEEQSVSIPTLQPNIPSAEGQDRR